MMKNLFFVFCLFITSTLSAQIGVKAGLIYNHENGTLKSLYNDYKNLSDNKIGYNIGIFKEFQLANFFIEPEIQYVHYTSEFESEKGIPFDITYNRIDVPVSVGKKLVGFLKLKTGPVFSYYFQDKIDWKDISNIQQDEISIGFHVGAGISLKKLHLDVRYDIPLSERQTDFIKDKQFNFKTENTPKLLHLSIGYEL